MRLWFFYFNSAISRFECTKASEDALLSQATTVFSWSSSEAPGREYGGTDDQMAKQRPIHSQDLTDVGSAENTEKGERFVPAENSTECHWSSGTTVKGQCTMQVPYQ